MKSIPLSHCFFPTAGGSIHPATYKTNSPWINTMRVWVHIFLCQNLRSGQKRETLGPPGVGSQFPSAQLERPMAGNYGFFWHNITPFFFSSPTRSPKPSLELILRACQGWGLERRGGSLLPAQISCGSSMEALDTALWKLSSSKRTMAILRYFGHIDHADLDWLNSHSCPTLETSHAREIGTLGAIYKLCEWPWNW